MFIGDSSPGTSRGECLSPLSAAVSPGALMQFTPAGDNQKCHQSTSREKREKEIWWQSKIRHQAQWKRQKKKHPLGDMRWGESLGRLKIPSLNVSTRFLNQNHKIFEINKHQCLFKRNTKLNHKMPISLEQFWLPDKSNNQLQKHPVLRPAKEQGWERQAGSQLRRWGRGPDRPSEGNGSMAATHGRSTTLWGDGQQAQVTSCRKSSRLNPRQPLH